MGVAKWPLCRGRSLSRKLKRDKSKCPLYRIAGRPLLRGLECIEVYGDTIRTFRIVRYIAGVRRCGVSVKLASVGLPKHMHALIIHLVDGQLLW